MTLPIHNIKKYLFISKLKELPFVEKVILFGSRARGTHQERSDIDLAIICPHATDKQWQEILDIIDTADTLLQIDCVNFHKASPDFQERILKDGIIV